MSAVKQLLSDQGRNPLCIGPDATVHQAACLMNEHRVGALVVVEDDRMIGIITERDILRRVIAERRHPSKTRVSQVMTAPAVTCSPHTTADEARAIMKNQRVRHIPVVDADRRVVGVISIGDLNAHLIVDGERTIRALHEYLYA